MYIHTHIYIYIYAGVVRAIRLHWEMQGAQTVIVTIPIEDILLGTEILHIYIYICIGRETYRHADI